MVIHRVTTWPVSLSLPPEATIISRSLMDCVSTERNVGSMRGPQ